MDHHKYSFIWKIKNYSMCALETANCIIESPTFRAESLGGSEWYLEIYPRGFDDDEFVSCYLCRVQNDEKEKVDFTVEMIGENDEILKRFEYKNNLVTDSGSGWNKCIRIEELNKKMENWKKDILTIHCLIESKSESTIFLVNESEAQTKIGVFKCYLKWNVELSDSTNFYNSRDLYPSEKLRFKLTMTAPNDEIEINIQRYDEDTSTPQTAFCKMSLINLKGKETESKTAKHLFLEDETNWKFPNFLSKKSLFERADELMLHNIFSFSCEFSVSTGEFLFELKSVKYKVPFSLNVTALDDSFSALHDDLRNMFRTHKMSDVKLRVESQIIPAHKFILVARSPVFSAMFDKDMLENQTGIVDIEDIDSNTLNSFLEYIYTGNVEELDVGKAMKLLVASDKYQVSSLTEKCFVYLKSRLSIENVCEVFTLADMIHHKCLKSSALGYIEANSREVLSSKIWCDWMNGNIELANEILYKLALEFSH